MTKPSLENVKIPQCHSGCALGVNSNCNATVNRISQNTGFNPLRKKPKLIFDKKTANKTNANKKAYEATLLARKTIPTK